jgi:hypothetical protein
MPFGPREKNTPGIHRVGSNLDNTGELNNAEKKENLLLLVVI